jgi:hypothetical protein
VDVEARVQLPSYVRGEIEVFVNGVAQVEGRDFRREPTSLVFNRPIAKEGKLGTIRWLSMLLGIAGTYRKHENVDVIYEREGRRTVATLTPSG